MTDRTLIVETSTLAGGGDAVGTLPDGRTVFVAGGAPDERVRIELVHEDKRWARGRIVEILKPSPNRVQPSFQESALGGATWAHIDYQAQLTAKAQIVRSALERIGKLTDPSIEPIVPSPEQWRYRNRIELTFGVSNGEVIVGFLAPGSDTEVIPTQDVALFDSVIQEVITRTNAWAQSSGLTAWQPRSRQGELRNLLVRRSIAGQHLVINLSTTSVAQPDKTFAEALSGLPVTGITWSHNDAPTVTHEAESVQVLQGSPYLAEVLNNRLLRYHVTDFFQVNIPAVELLLRRLEGRLGSPDRLIDLYAGVGLLGFGAADQATELTLVESHQQSMRDAAWNAKELDREVTIVPQSAEEYVANRRLPSEATVIVDPPRSGLDRSVVDALNAATLSKLIYVSCDPATLARDLNLLRDRYRPVFIQPFDFFPQTHHVETLVELHPILSFRA